MGKIRVLMNFTKQTGTLLLATAGAVVKGLAGDAGFDVKAIETAASELSEAIAAQPHGGVAATAVRDNKRDKLIAHLMKAAHHVQDNCDDDPAKVLSAGFQVKTFNRSATTLEVPSNVTIDFGRSSELVVKVNRIPNARTYEVRVAPIGPDGAVGPWQSAVTFTNSRGMTITGLKSLTTYSIQVRAVGAAGPTDWSDPVSHLCV